MTTTAITNAYAVRTAYEFMKGNGYDNAEVLAKLEKHLATLEKPRAKAEGPTKVAKENSEACARWAEWMNEGDSYTNAQLAETFGVSSPKATAILKQGEADGVIRALWVEGTKYYQLAK